MSILNKQLSRAALATLDLFLQGALAPLNGYLSREDHLSVLRENRLANGYLWPLAFTLELSAAEKRQAQLLGRIALLDEEQRTIAELDIEDIYRLTADSNTTPEQAHSKWYVGGTIKAVSKVLHPAFNRIRRNTGAMQHKLQDSVWQHVIATHINGEMNRNDMLQACAWLQAQGQHNGGILLQVSATDSPQLHEQMRELRHSIRCNAANKVVLSLLPKATETEVTRQLLLQARIAKNYGATAFLIPSTVSSTTRKAILRYRDELGLELIPARRSKTVSSLRQQQRVQALQKIAA